MLGIAISTYNRRDMVVQLINTLRRLTSCQFMLVVCDDGSSDGTVEAVQNCGAKIIAGINRGIAWNKNRGLFYLREICGSQTILLLDDDVLPTVAGWEQEWISGAERFGHVNWRAPAHSVIGGSDIVADPGISTSLAGPCLAFSRQALSYIGYMDTRFRGYGHEHTDLTIRAIRAGFGGFATRIDEEIVHYFYVIKGGLTLFPVQSSSDATSIKRNHEVFLQSFSDSIYRNPWRSEEEYNLLRSEMAEFDGLNELRAPHALRFDSEGYLAANPDVAAASFNALHHYLVFGIRENRIISCNIAKIGQDTT